MLLTASTRFVANMKHSILKTLFSKPNQADCRYCYNFRGGLSLCGNKKTLKKSSKSCMKPAYTRMVSVCFIISLLTTAYPVSTTFLNLQKLSGPAYTDAAFSLSITNSEAFAETLGLILGGNAFPKLLQNTVFHVFSFVIDLCSAGISIFFNVLRTVNAFFTEPLGTSFVFLIIGLCITFLYHCL